MPIDFERVRAICFDIDGTLSDTDDVMVAKATRILTPLKKIRPEFQPEKTARRWVMGLEAPGNWVFTLADRLGIDDEIAWISERIALLNRKPPAFQLISGVDNLLRQCFERLPLAIVSARDQSGSLRFLNQFDLEPFFRQVITGQTCTHTKPYPDPILHAAEHFGLAASEILMVGDTTVDITAARKAGAQSVGVLCGFGEAEELIRAGANEILPSTADLIRYFA